MLSGFSRGLKFCFHILNIYVHDVSRKRFLDHLDCYGILKIGSLILAGDLNNTMAVNGVSSIRCKLDLLGDYFKELFS